MPVCNSCSAGRKTFKLVSIVPGAARKTTEESYPYLWSKLKLLLAPVSHVGPGVFY